jgi:hypothetical protein
MAQKKPPVLFHILIQYNSSDTHRMIIEAAIRIPDIYSRLFRMALALNIWLSLVFEQLIPQDI